MQSDAIIMVTLLAFSLVTQHTAHVLHVALPQFLNKRPMSLIHAHTFDAMLMANSINARPARADAHAFNWSDSARHACRCVAKRANMATC